MNSIVNRIEADFIEAYKAKDETKSSVLRMLKSSLKNMAIEKKGELDDAEAIKVLQREIKQRRESIEQYRQGGRDDLADKEATEIPVLESYLPVQLSEAEITEIAKKAVEEVGASSRADFGKVMGKIMPLVAGKADGNLVSKVVSNLLSND